MDKKNLLELMQTIIRQETKYLRTYKGKVVNNVDQVKKGRVQVLIPSLGWDDNSKAVWAFPTDKNSMTVPKINDWVRVGFMEGRIERPYYFGVVNEVEGQTPKNYDGIAQAQVIYEDSNEEMYIKYDETTKTFTISDAHGNTWEMKSGSIDIGGTTINMLGATESFVKGTTFQPEMVKDQALMQVLQAGITAWVPVPNDGGAALKAALAAYLALPQGDFTNILSSTIKGE